MLSDRHFNICQNLKGGSYQQWILDMSHLPQHRLYISVNLNIENITNEYSKYILPQESDLNKNQTLIS